ncbi:hydrogenase maturation protease [Nocardia sp. 004]|uniref:hydrogenase maturation protease n=1 Tax=Nocardia sp. 004 TaxID=3385978 RepID=UPI0039A308AD
MTGARAVVIGVGNEYRHDDGIGPFIALCIEKYCLPDVFVTISDGEPTGLIDNWSDASLAVVIDAALCEPSTPGRVRRNDIELLTHSSATSTHASGIPDAWSLGCALGRIPDKLVVFSVEASCFDYGVGLSAQVAAAVPQTIEAVLAELKSAQP